jgi:FKBP-type peptidyl-prolyl cis-trans isomerase FkpA
MKFSLFSILTACTLLIVSCKSDETRTPSGYDFTVEAGGSGEPAKAGDHVSFSVKIMGDDGKVIQDMPEGPNMPTIQVPEKFEKGANANPVIELLLNSKVGGVYKLYMPIDSIPNAPEDFKKLKHIVYEIGVKKIETDQQHKHSMEEKQAALQATLAQNLERLPAIEDLVKSTLADYKAGKLDVKSTASGVKYYIVKSGDGPNAANGNTVSVNYYGSLMDGKMFDTSFNRGQSFPFTLGVGQVIKGWDEGVAQLNKGARAFLFIPAALGYGDAGSPPTIPAKADLAFYVELDDIKVNN